MGGAQSFDERVNESVQQILSDTTQLPAEFISYLPQIVAQNPVTTAKTSGVRLAYGTNTSNVSTTGTTFGTGADLLSTALEFTATGSNSYIVRVSARTWNNSLAVGTNQLNINLDGADKGQFASWGGIANSGPQLDAAGLIITPSAGGHSVNVRLFVTSGTGIVAGGVGGAGADVPILVTIEVA